MIDVECPHCRRVLRVPRQYAGIEGACKYCGGRLIIPEEQEEGFEPSPHAAKPDAPSSPDSGTHQEAIKTLHGNVEVLQAQLKQNRLDIERLARDLETERTARVEAEVGRDATLARAKRAEENLTALAGKGDDEALRAEIEHSTFKVAEVRLEVERLSKELEAERVARAEAEVARDVALVRVRRLDANLANIAEKGEDGGLRAALECAEAQLAQSRVDVERLARELETERLARVRAEAAHQMMELRTRRVQEQFRRLIHEKTAPKAEAAPTAAAAPVVASPEVPQDTPVTEEIVLPVVEITEEPPSSESTDVIESELELSIDALVPDENEIDNVVDVGEVEDESEAAPAPETETGPEEAALPESKPARRWLGWAAAILWLVAVAGGVGAYYTKPLWMRPAALPTAAAPDGGTIEATVTYMTSRQPETPTAPAARAQMIVAKQQLDTKAFEGLLQEAAIPQETWNELAQWFYLAEPDIPDAKQFPSADVADEAPLAAARRALAAYADKAGRDAFNKRLAEILAFDAPKDWAEETASETGMVTVRNLVPGRYAILPRPDGPREAWRPLEPASKDLTVLVVRKGETARCVLKWVDTVSAIRGQVTDLESGKPLAKLPLAVSGDITAGKKLTVTTKEDGSFMLDPLDTGYGAFSVSCVALPKGYLNSTTFSGMRERGVVLEPGMIQLSKKAAPKETKKTTLSGRVLGPDGSPASGFGIWAVGEDGSAKSLARSGRDGTYELPHTGGTLRLYAAGRGSARTEPVAVELQPNQSATRDFVLPACGRIVLNIKKPDGSVPDAFDECNLVCPARVMSDPSMMQREGDKFVIAYLTGGVYDLTFRVKGFKPVSLPGTQIDKNGGDKELSATLEPIETAPPPASP